MEGIEIFQGVISQGRYLSKFVGQLRRYRFDVAPLSGLQKRKLTRGRWKEREKARSCFITKAADIKFHRQTWNSRVRGTSVFRLLFATGGPCRRRKPCASIGQIRAKNKARLQKIRGPVRKERLLSNVRDSLVKNKNSKISFYILTREILAYSRLIRNFHIFGMVFFLGSKSLEQLRQPWK